MSKQYALGKVLQNLRVGDDFESQATDLLDTLIHHVRNEVAHYDKYPDWDEKNISSLEEHRELIEDFYEHVASFIPKLLENRRAR